MATKNKLKKSKKTEGAYSKIYQPFLTKADMQQIVSNLTESSGQGTEVLILEDRSLPLAVKRSPMKNNNAYQQFQAEKILFEKIKPNKNIVGFYGCYEDTEFGYLFMEPCPKSLTSAIEGQTIQLQDILGITIDVVKGLQHLHETGVVHCDLKPDNIMFGKDNKVRLIDFGAATKIGGTTNFGTPGYYARGDWKAKVERDIYALGTILLQMLCLETGTDIELKKSQSVTIQNYAQENKGKGIISSKLCSEKDINNEVSEKLMGVALDCTKEKSNQRLSLEQILKILEDLQQGGSSKLSKTK